MQLSRSQVCCKLWSRRTLARFAMVLRNRSRYGGRYVLHLSSFLCLSMLCSGKAEASRSDRYPPPFDRFSRVRHRFDCQNLPTQGVLPLHYFHLWCQYLVVAVSLHYSRFLAFLEIKAVLRISRQGCIG